MLGSSFVFTLLRRKKQCNWSDRQKNWNLQNKFVAPLVNYFKPVNDNLSLWVDVELVHLLIMEMGFDQKIRAEVIHGWMIEIKNEE